MTQPARETHGDGRDTRSRIQAVALELFTEQGYEKTSLRELAERLGVSKAALYYHFKTKEEIVESLLADRLAAVDRLIDWARRQPPGEETRREFVRRYAASLRSDSNRAVMGFLERNQTAIKALPAADQLRCKILELARILSAPDDSPQQRLKNWLALFALHANWFVLRDLDMPDQHRSATALDVALDLVTGR